MDNGFQVLLPQQALHPDVPADVAGGQGEQHSLRDRQVLDLARGPGSGAP